MNLIPLNKALLCVSCHTISDTPGSSCPACGDKGCLLPLYNTLIGERKEKENRQCQSIPAS